MSNTTQIFRKGDRVRRVTLPNTDVQVGSEYVVEGVSIDGRWIGLVGVRHGRQNYAAMHFELAEEQVAVEAKRNSILDTAKQLIEGSRAEQYGSFAHNAKQQADLWNAYLSDGKGGIRSITPMDVPAMMVLVKLMRLSGNTTHQDSWVDVAGFAGLAEQVHDGTVAPAPKPTPADVPLVKGERVRVFDGPVRIKTVYDSRGSTMYGSLRQADKGATGTVSHGSGQKWVSRYGSKIASRVVYVDFDGGHRTPVPSLWLERV